MFKDDENWSADERRIAEMVGGLKRVDAPGNFETRVRARIASSDRSPSTGRLRPVLAAVAAAIMITFAAYVGFRSLRPAVDAPVAKVSENAPPTSALPTPQIVPSSNSPAPNAPAVKGGTLASEKPANALRPQRLTMRGGSLDEASKDTRTLPVPVKTILSGIGIRAVWDDAGWRVDFVAAGELADRSGVKTGDVIESINGQRLTENTTFRGAITRKSIRVRRDGPVLDLPFKP